MNSILKFISENWINLLLVVVGSFALVTYILQMRKKEIEAASLIVLQIDDLEKRLREFSSYIVEKRVDFTAFYESIPLMGENYWDKYKHYFIRKMDYKSFSNINLFFDLASEILEQQLVLKKMQKDSFSSTQNLLLKIL